MSADWAMVGLTAVYVAATIIICVSNCRTAKASQEQVAAMQRQYETDNRPYITVEIIYERKSFYGLRFANHGKRLADKVRIKFDQSCLDSLNEPSYRERLQQAEDKECIIGVGQHYDLYFGSNKARENPNIILSGKVIYYDANHPYTEPFGIDFSSYATFYSVNSSADDLLNEMKKQTKALQDINANLQLLVKTNQTTTDTASDKPE